MQKRFVIPLIIFFVVLTIFGVGRYQHHEIEIPEQLIIYSIIDPKSHDINQLAKNEEMFHDYTVLGKIDVKDQGKLKEVYDAFKKGMIQSDGSMHRCFKPRHAIRLVENGKTTDFVISFECYRMNVFSNVQKWKSITPSLEVVLNKHLKEAGIPLATE